MKVKKESVKIKNKKNKLHDTKNVSIKKIKKKKVKKVENDSEVADAIQKEAGSRVPLRQETWNAYLKIVLANEKLDDKQKQIIEFCTSKSLTPPRRKQKFLNFIRNCYDNQKDVTDEECNELFDLVLKKYDDYKAGKYTALVNNDILPESGEPSSTKLSRKKKKKLSQTSNNDSATQKAVKTEEVEEKWEKTKSKKKRRQKPSNKSSEDDDVDMDE